MLNPVIKKPRSMSEHRAWLYLAGRCLEAKKCVDGNYGIPVTKDRTTLGLCTAVRILWYESRISKRTRDSMLDQLDDRMDDARSRISLSGYLYRTDTRAGCRARARLCLKLAEKTGKKR